MSRPAPRRGALRRALGQMAQDPWLQLTAISSLSVALAIVGAYLTLCFNLQDAARRLSTGASLMLVLKDEVSPARGRALALGLAARPQVESARYLSRAQALERFRRQLGPHAGLLEGLGKNPLPQSVELLLRPAAPLEPLMAELKNLEPVQEVVTSRPWLHRLEEAVGVMREIAGALGLLLFVGVVFLVSNTVRLAVYVRRQQLEVMELVGASTGYMRRPFLWEAVIQALVASGLASLLVAGIFRVLGSPAALPLGLDLGRLLRMPPQVPLVLGAVALAAGLLGGFLGVGRALKTRGW